MSQPIASSRILSNLPAEAGKKTKSGWRNFGIAMVALAVAFALAIYSGAAAQVGAIWAASAALVGANSKGWREQQGLIRH